MGQTAIISPQILDSSAIGRSVLTAADLAAAQAILGIAPLDVTADYNWTGNHSFSGGLREYMVGEAGDANTAYLEFWYDGVNAQIASLASGSQSRRPLYVGGVYNGTDSGIIVGGSPAGYLRTGSNTTAAWSATALVSYVDFRPQTDGNIECGRDGNRWESVYSVDGSFTGNLTSEVGGTVRHYSTGTEGDTDTSFIEIGDDGTRHTVYTNQTGAGAYKSLRIGNSLHYMEVIPTSARMDWYTSGVKRFSVGSSSVSFKDNLLPISGLAPNIGSSSLRWLGVYAQDGDFSGTVTANAFVGDGSGLTNLPAGGNPFDQDLNTTDSPEFVGGTFTGNVTIDGSLDNTNLNNLLSILWSGVEQYSFRYNKLLPKGTAKDLGGSTSRWSTIYGVDGSFSGNLNTEVGGSNRVYNLGSDGDTDTEYLETSWDSNVATIQPKKTGAGALRRLDVLAGDTGMSAYANSTLIVRSEWSSINMNNSTILFAAPSSGHFAFRYGDLRPFDAVTPINCGQPAVPWAGVYSVDGDFSGSVTTGGLKTAIGGTLSTSVTLTTSDHTILCDCQLNNISVNLPTAVGNDGQVFVIKKVDATANFITVFASGAETIDGGSIHIINTTNESIHVQAYSGAWFII